MRTIIFILLFLIAIPSTAQDSIPNITETERIIDKYGEKVINGFNEVVEKATPYAEQGFELAVKLQIAKGIGGLILTSLFIICLILLYLLWGGKHLNDENVSPFGVGVIVMAIVLLFPAIFNTYDSFLHLMAPEWYAIRDIVDLIP